MHEEDIMFLFWKNIADMNN